MYNCLSHTPILRIFNRLKHWAQLARRDLHAIYLAARDPRVPWHAKAVAFFVAGYAFSPIDLIPDFVPVLGYLDDLIIVPIGIWLAVRLIPAEILAEHRAAAELAAQGPVSKFGAAVIIAIWLLLAVGGGWIAYRFFKP
jgi:uncharacterized membrane protein YkvA (DUF1232 family)